MTYEKPVIIDLSSRSEKGFGDGCTDGSGETLICLGGPTAAQSCGAGSAFRGGHSKYDD